MEIKRWTADQIRALIEEAESEGIDIQTLVRDYIGCARSALNHWLTGRRSPSRTVRRALTLAEYHVRTRQVPIEQEQLERLQRAGVIGKRNGGEQ